MDSVKSRYHAPMPAHRRPPLAHLVAAAVLLSCSPAQPSDPTQPLASPLTSAPLVGPESRIDEPVYTEQSGEQSQPFIAAVVAASPRAHAAPPAARAPSGPLTRFAGTVSVRR